jgi:hypothetical protein
LPHLKNDWHKNELASPDGVSAAVLKDGTKRLAVVDQWNSRIIMYDLDVILKNSDCITIKRLFGLLFIR